MHFLRPFTCRATSSSYCNVFTINLITLIDEKNLRMKLALILLTLFCVYVSVSHQQQRRYPMPYYYYNSYYNSPPQLSRHWMKQAPYYVVRNNYVQPSFDEQISMVIRILILMIFKLLLSTTFYFTCRTIWWWTVATLITRRMISFPMKKF